PGHRTQNPLPKARTHETVGTLGDRHPFRRLKRAVCPLSQLQWSFMISRAEAIEMFESPDLIGIGMEADAIRRRLHPEGIVSYIIDRNINYTNFCTEYCSFCAFYRPLKGKLAAEGYILDFDTIYDKIRETVEMGGTGVLMQGGIHPDLKIDWFESL